MLCRRLMTFRDKLVARLQDSGNPGGLPVNTQSINTRYCLLTAQMPAVPLREMSAVCVCAQGRK